MNQATVTSQKTLETILDRLDKLTKEVQFIKERITEVEPPYGSDIWWQWSDARAIKSIREGKGTTIRNKRELDEFFKNL
ncbi:hypothetical protein HYU92_05515 [Candidatus Curtissbacteria bacterium]|nr:hypothetical protein [Candidatus Curtissbacteria bacterium]